MFCYIYVFLFIKGHCLPSVHWWGVGVNKSGDGDHRASVCLCRPVYHSERVVKQHCLKKEIVLDFFFFSESHHPPTACVLGCLVTFSSQGISESARIALLMFGFHVVTIGLLCLGSAFYIFSNTNTFYENVSFTVLKKLSA